jgi:hypothetical protein
MGNDRNNSRRDSPRTFAWLDRGVSAVCAVMLLVGAVLFCFAAFEFSFASKWDAASRGLDAMSDGILFALIGVMARVCYSAVGLLLANLLDERSTGERA